MKPCSHISSLCCGIFISIMMAPFSSAQQDEPRMVKFVLVGDSTVADYKPDDILRGWGQEIVQYFKPSVKVINLAICGKSTKTFFYGGNWEKALLEKADFIFIQFGHNDSHSKEKPEATDANSDYMENLRRYVREAREAGSKPILVTPMHRLMFDPHTGKLTQELAPYVDAMKRVGLETDVPVIDLYTETGKVFETYGTKSAVGICVSDTDRTHFTEKGARIIAGIVTKEAAKVDPVFAALIK